MVKISKEKTAVVQKPSISGPKSVNIQETETCSGPSTSWWDSDSWKEFCNLTFSSGAAISLMEAPQAQTTESAESDSKLSAEKLTSRRYRDDKRVSLPVEFESKPDEEENGVQGSLSSGRFNSHNPSTESIIIYLDGDSHNYRQETAEPPTSAGALDMLPLIRIRLEISGLNENCELWREEVLQEYLKENDLNLRAKTNSPLHRLIDDLTAVGKVLAFRKLKNVEEDRSASGDTLGSSCASGDYLWLLRRLAEHNDQISLAPIHSQLLSNPVITDLWIRESVKDKWQQKYKLAKISGDVFTGGDKEKEANGQEERVSKKRTLDECFREQIKEFQQGLQETLARPLQELEELDILYAAQQHLLLRDKCTITELVSSFDAQQTHLSRIIDAQLTLLDNQSQALSGLMDFSLRTGHALETRINRLSAKDVKHDDDERQRVKEWRLAQPEALMYLLKAQQDLQLLRDQAKSVVVGCEGIERDLNRLAGAVVDNYAMENVCWLMAADRARDDA